MSQISVFSSPLLLGFDRVERLLDRAAKSANDGYPPYNIEQLGENALRITLAVAGFSLNELSLTLEDNQLCVRGKQADEPGRSFLHRGIAARQFQRSFVLAEGIEIQSARLENGLLQIELLRPQPVSTVRSIQITDGKTAPQSLRSTAKSQVSKE